MVRIKKLVLDVLKPHHPNALEFTTAMAEMGGKISFKLYVDEIDEKTESVILTVEADHINYEAVEKRIQELGASVHSIDEVEVVSTAAAGKGS